MQAKADGALACMLPAGVLQQRLARIERVTARDLLSHRLDGPNLYLTYKAQARSELEQVVALERECCAFLRFELRDSLAGPELGIHAPDGNDQGARWLFEQFLPKRQPVHPRRSCGCAPGACA